MANTINWGQAAVENTIDYGQGATDNTISWGKSQTLSPSGETNITGAGGTPAFTNTLSTTFDGTDDFVNVADNNNLSFGDSVNDSPFSISAWIKFDNIGSRQGIVSKFSATNNCEYGFFLESNNTLKVYLFDGASTKIRGKASTAITTGVWNYVTFTYDGQGGSSAYNGMKIYLNGVDISSSNVTLNTYTAMHNMSAPLKIGEYFGNYASGNIDEVSIFNTQLSSSDITSIYNSGTPTDLTSYSPISWWRMGDGSTYPTINDLGSGSNDGTMTNMSAANFVTDVPTASTFSNTLSTTFDGTDDFCETATTYSELNGLDKATFSFWIKPPSTITSIQVISSVMMSASSSQRQYQIQLYTSGLIQYDSIVGGNYIRANSTALNLGQWNHVLFCIDTTQVGANRGRVFINGVDETGANTISSTLPTSTTGLFIGKQGNGQYNPFDGLIDEFAIWAGTDQRANVSEIYSASGAVDLNTLPTAPNPTTWYRMGDNDTYPTILDKNGSANLTMTNMSAANFVTDVPT